MKVKDLIERLQSFDPELPVAIADWTEDCMAPSEECAEDIGILTEGYYPKGSAHVVKGTFVCIG